MTIAAIDPIKRYAGNSSTSTFSFPYPFGEDEDLQVYIVVNATGVATLQTLDTHYIVTGAGEDDGGSVSFIDDEAAADPPATGETVVIVRKPELDQAFSIPSAGGFPSVQGEEAFDRIYQVLQYLNWVSGRSIALHDAADGTDADLRIPIDRASQVIGFDEDSNVALYPIPEDIPAIQALVDVAQGHATTATAQAVIATAQAVLAEASADAAAASQAALNLPSISISDAGKVIAVNETGDGYVVSNAGSGDLVSTNNLSDVTTPATAFANIKQAASDTATGVVELATDAEVQTGTDTARAVTPAGLRACTATDTRIGVVELATSAETITGTDTARAVTPAGLAALTGTSSRAGLLELATNAETQTGTDTDRAVTPAGLSATTATEARAGVVELATNAEVTTGSDTARAVTPAGVAQAYAKLAGGQTLTGGFAHTSFAINSGNPVTTGTVTPDPASGGFQHYTANGAHTLAPPSSTCSIIVEILNGASAGTITTSGFTKVKGDAPTTTNAHKFHAVIVKSQNYSSLTWVALQ